MKTVDLKSFAKDAIKRTDLNYLKGGLTKGDPVEDLIHPPVR
jgi:hypothetical protein